MSILTFQFYLLSKKALFMCSDLNQQIINTKAALITPPGVGGVGVIQVRGKNAFKVLEIFAINPKQPNKVHFTKIYEAQNLVDEVIIRYFCHEDQVVEICCHGGLAVTNAIFTITMNIGIARVKKL